MKVNYLLKNFEVQIFNSSEYITANCPKVKDLPRNYGGSSRSIIVSGTGHNDAYNLLLKLQLKESNIHLHHRKPVT